MLRLPAHRNVPTLKGAYVHPSQVGFYQSAGEWHGQIADWRLTFVDDPRCIHVLEYEGYYLVHWDYRDPSRDPLGHLQYDAPQYVPVVVFGGIVGVLGLVSFLETYAA